MFLLDANILMTAADFHYPVDVVPNFWGQILEMLDAGEAMIPKSVHDELGVYKQKWTSDWVATKVSPQHILEENASHIQKLTEITNWVMYERQPAFPSKELRRFFKGADPKIIAAAAVEKCTIVTYEKPVADPNSKKAKIPDIAAQFGVKCVNPVEMFRQLGRKM